ncbi:NARE ribosyltransferase, partial [Atlantisia rogersi]|nr:NARE ribosyltransferase [Atlantisia rogersi]
SLPAMEHLALGLVWLLGTVASVSPMHKEVPIMEMDMVPNSFDDQYLGCSEMMEEKLQELNYTEFDTNEIYAVAWKEAITQLQGRMSQSSVLQPVQAIALMAYTLNDPPLQKEFNAAVHEAGRSREEYLHNFQFKALHFLLTKALHALRDVQPHHCYHVYLGVVNIIFTAQPGEIVRFGMFAYSSLDKMHAENIDKGTIFSVETCYGVLIRDFSFFQDEDEVLIPPFETFKVTRMTHKGNRSHIELHSQDAYSNYNCEFLKGDVLGDG